jgi:hypothetical protein
VFIEEVSSVEHNKLWLNFFEVLLMTADKNELEV